MIYDFTDSQIETAFNKVISKKVNEGKNEKEISRLTLEQLQKGIPKVRTKKKERTMNVSQMRDFLGIDNKEE